MIVFTNDKDRLLTHFEKDPVLFAYHIGDLDDFHFPHCQWASIYGDRPHIVDCVLIYTGLRVPTVLAFGLTERFAELVADLVDLLPSQFYAHYDAAVESIFTSRYDCKSFGPHNRMTVKRFAPADESLPADASIVRLDSSHESALNELFARAYPESYFNPRMLQSGRYLAVETDGRMVSVAGVHVDSEQFQTAVLGNIATDPAFRGRGLASVLTSQLTSELLDAGRRVSLNVHAENAAAVRCYEKLGFVTAHQHIESYFTLKT